jgi:hypothetical protein
MSDASTTSTKADTVKKRPNRSGDSWTRSLIALVVVGSSLAVILIISGVAIALADNRSSMSRLVFTSVLPLLGTWVGTVLAFYFARENLEAATDSTLALAGGRTETVVTKVMIREADILAHDLAANEDPKAVTLAAVRETMGKMDPPGRRVPIRDANRVVLYVLHDSTLAAYAEELPAGEKVDDKTIGDLLDDPKYRQLIEANGFVSEKATISEARTVMTSIENCNDVFVTPTGKRDERAVGWLTNTLLAGIQ